MAVADAVAPDELDDSATRGLLIIKERAVTKIAVAAALGVPGVVRQSGGLTRLTGRELPRADVSMGSDAVAINLYVGVRWPCRLAPLTRRLHEEVGRQIEGMTGLPLHELNVVIAGTEAGSAEAQAEDSLGYHGAEERYSPAPAPVEAPRTPRATPAAVPAATLIAFAVLALALASGRELLIARGTIPGAPWLRNSFEWLGRLHWSEWIVPVAVGSIVLGIVFIGAALKPRPRTHLPVRGGGQASIVWLRPTDLARNCSSEAVTVPGVASARTTVDRKRVTVHVIRNEADSAPEIASAVHAAVQPNVALLGTALALQVKVKR